MIDAVKHMQTMKTAVRLGRKPRPYLYEQFNLIFSYVNQSTYVRSIAARILNALIQTFNRKNKLLTYIVVMSEKDILDNIGYFESGTPYIIKRIVNWLTREINRAVNSRISDLIRKNPGAVRSCPYVIWIQLFQRPESEDNIKNHINSYWQEFNLAMNNAICKYRDHHTISITSIETQHFNGSGDLTALGYEKLWKEIDFRMKQFDRGDIDLKPTNTAR